ncbi:hypothetical protein ACQEUV_26560 [Micromonospora aurantiaca (nom. illeg.)]|uniref:hypothetical protein n=1 Tax=Micromonospora aurantiaca (nom. illeg.) TaxID=47850 RepID=UPI003DA34278
MAQIVPHPPLRAVPSPEPQPPADAGLTHPSWCDPQACTAKPAPQLEDYQGGVDYGRHVSATARPAGHAMRLTRAVAPWSTLTFLTVQEDAPYVAIDLATFGACLGELGVAQSGPLSDAELADGRERAGSVRVPAGTGAGDRARRYLARRVQALVTEEGADPLRLVAELRQAFAVYTALSEGRSR